MSNPEEYDETGKPLSTSAAAVTPGPAADAGAAAASTVNSPTATSMIAALQKARAILAARSGAPAPPPSDPFSGVKKVLADRVAPPAYLQGGPLLDDLAIKDAAVKGALPPEALLATHEAEFRGLNHPAQLVPRPSPFPGPPMLSPGEDPRTSIAPPVVPTPLIPDYSYLDTVKQTTTPVEIRRQGYLDRPVPGSTSGMLMGPDGVTVPMPSDPAGLARLGTTRRLALIQQFQSGNVVDAAAANQALLEWKDQDARIRERFGLPPGINILLPHGKAPGIDIAPIREALLVAETVKDRTRGIPIDNKAIGDRVAGIIRAEVTSAGGTLHGIPTYEIDRNDWGADALAWVNQAKRTVGEALLGEKGSDGAIVSALKGVGFSDDLSRDFGRGLVTRLMYPLEASAFVAAHTNPISVARNLGTLDERELAGEGGIGFFARAIDPITPMIAARSFGAELSDPDYLVFVRRGGGIINSIPEIADLAARQSIAERMVREGLSGVGVDTTTPNEEPWYTQVPALAANAAAGLVFRSSYSVVTGAAELGAEVGGLVLGTDPNTNLFELRRQEEYPEFMKSALGAGLTLGAIFITPDALSTVVAPVAAKTIKFANTYLDARKRAKGLPVGALEESLFAAKSKIDSLLDNAPPEDVNRVVSALSRDPIFGVVFSRHYAVDLARRMEEITGRPPDVAKEPGAAIRSNERRLLQAAQAQRDAAQVALGKTREKLATAKAALWRVVPSAVEPRVANSGQLRLPDGSILKGKELETAREFAGTASEAGVPLDRLTGGRLRIAERLGIDPLNKTAREVAEEVAEALAKGKVETPDAVTADELAEVKKALDNEDALNALARTRNWIGAKEELQAAARAVSVRAAGFNVPPTLAESRSTIYGALKLLFSGSPKQEKLARELLDATTKSAKKKIFAAADPATRAALKRPELQRLIDQMDSMRSGAAALDTRVNRAKRFQEIIEARKIKQNLAAALARGEKAKGVLDPALASRPIGTDRPAALERALAAQRAAGGGAASTQPAAAIDRAREMVARNEKFSLESSEVNPPAAVPVVGVGDLSRQLEAVQNQLQQYEDILRGTDVLAVELRAAAGSMPKDLKVSDLPAKWDEAANEALQTSTEYSIAISEVDDIIRTSLEEVLKSGDEASFDAVDAVADSLLATRLGQDVTPKYFADLLLKAKTAIRADGTARVAAAKQSVEDAEQLVSAARTSKKDVMALMPRVSELVDVATKNVADLDKIYSDTLSDLIRDGAKREDARKALEGTTTLRKREADRLRALLAFRESAATAIALTDPKAVGAAVNRLARTARTNDAFRELAAGLMVARNAAEQALGLSQKALKAAQVAAKAAEDDGARILSALASSQKKLLRTRTAARAPLKKLQTYRDLFDAARVEAVRDQTKAAMKPLREKLARLAGIGPAEMRKVAILMAREFSEVAKLRKASGALAAVEGGGKARLLEVYNRAAEQLPRVQQMLRDQPWRGVKNPLSNSLALGGTVDSEKFRANMLSGGISGWVIRQFIETRGINFPVFSQLMDPATASAKLSDEQLSELGQGLDSLNLFNKEASVADPRNVLATAALLNMEDVYAPVTGHLVKRILVGIKRFIQINIKGDADLANFGQFRGVYHTAVRSSVASTELGMEEIGGIQASSGDNYSTELRQYLTSTTPIKIKVGGDWGLLSAPGTVSTLGNRGTRGNIGETPLWEKAVAFIKNNPVLAKELGLLDGLARSHIPDNYLGNVPEEAFLRLRKAAEESLSKSPSLYDFEDDMAAAIKLVFNNATVSRTVRADTFMAVNVIQAAALDDFATDMWKVQNGMIEPGVARDINKIISLNRVAGERGSNALQLVEDFESGLQGLNRWGKSMITGKIEGFDAGAGMRRQEKLVEAVTLVAMADERNAAVVPMHLLREAVASMDSVIKEGGQFAVAPLPSFSPFGKNLTRLVRMGLLHGIFMRNQRYFGNIFFGDFSAMLATVSPTVATSVTWASAPSMIPWIGPAIQKTLGLVRAGKPIPSMSLGMSNRTLARMLDGEDFYVKFGSRTYHTTELIEIMRRGGVLETAVSADVLSGAGAAAEAIHGGRQGAGLGAIAFKRLEDWTESIALMAHEQQRRTRVLLFLELLNQGEESNHAAKLVRASLFDWKHGLVRSELNGPIAKLSMFWRYHRLKTNWIVNKMLDIWDSPSITEGALGQSSLARVTRSVQVTSAIPRLAAQFGGMTEVDTREYDQWLTYAHPEWMNGRYAMSAPMEQVQRQYMRDRGYGIKDTTAWAIPSSTAMDAAQLVINTLGGAFFSSKALLEYAVGDPRAHATMTHGLSSLITAATSVVSHPYMDFVLSSELFARDWPLKPAEVEMFSRLPIIKDMIGRGEDGVPVLPGFMVAIWQLFGRSMFLSGPLDIGNAFLSAGGQPAVESAAEVLFNVSGLGRPYYLNAEAMLTQRSQATSAGLHAAVERARAQARGAPPR